MNLFKKFTGKNNPETKKEDVPGSDIINKFADQPERIISRIERLIRTEANEAECLNLIQHVRDNFSAELQKQLLDSADLQQSKASEKIRSSLDGLRNHMRMKIEASTATQKAEQEKNKISAILEEYQDKHIFSQASALLAAKTEIEKTCESKQEACNLDDIDQWVKKSRQKILSGVQKIEEKHLIKNEKGRIILHGSNWQDLREDAKTLTNLAKSFGDNYPEIKTEITKVVQKINLIDDKRWEELIERSIDELVKCDDTPNGITGSDIWSELLEETENVQIKFAVSALSDVHAGLSKISQSCSTDLKKGKSAKNAMKLVAEKQKDLFDAAVSEITENLPPEKMEGILTYLEKKKIQE